MGDEEVKTACINSPYNKIAGNGGYREIWGQEDFSVGEMEDARVSLYEHSRNPVLKEVISERERITAGSLETGVSASLKEGM